MDVVELKEFKQYFVGQFNSPMKGQKLEFLFSFLYCSIGDEAKL